MSALENIAAEVESKVGHLGFQWYCDTPTANTHGHVGICHPGFITSCPVIVHYDAYRDEDKWRAVWDYTVDSHKTTWREALKAFLDAEVETNRCNAAFAAQVLRKALDSVEA